MATALIPVRPNPAVYKIRNKATKTNLNLNGGEGTKLTGWSNSASTDQQWQLAALGNGGIASLVMRGAFWSQQQKRATGGSQQPATAQHLAPNNKKGRWVFEAIGIASSGDYFIRSVEKKELVLDLYEAGSADGTEVYTWPQHQKPEDWQIWNLETV